MQQLVWKFLLLEEQNIIQLELEPKLNWESFTELAESFCFQFKLQKISLSLGADRAQLHFNTGLGDFLLYYESLCDSLWVEVFVRENKKQLTDFYNLKLNVLR
ncbi:MAG: hypothetical protein ACI8Z9_000474 [Paraglaciecola sp.]|jgi:hypothetical protein